MSNRFDLEQQILECWRVVDDIKLWNKQQLDSEKWAVLSEYYEAKFNNLWAVFEEMCQQRKFVTVTSDDTTDDEKIC